MKKLYKALVAGAALSALAAAGPALAQQSKSDPDAKVYIISPADGDTVESPVRVVFGLRNMGVAPAGVKKKNTGHHHLLIDTEAPDGRDLKHPLPKDKNNRHYGGGETEALVELEPGEHTLQLILADHNHIPHKPEVLSDQITITVAGATEEDAPEDEDDAGEDDDKEDEAPKRDGGLLGILGGGDK
ncbi:MAG: DUF4399 domain-containing protein, partial [Alphaproteobacteria bacterium]